MVLKMESARYAGNGFSIGATQADSNVHHFRKKSAADLTITGSFKNDSARKLV